MELLLEMKKQIDDSRKTPIFEMLTQEEVEKEFLWPLRFCGTPKQFRNYGSCHWMYPLVLWNQKFHLERTAMIAYFRIVCIMTHELLRFCVLQCTKSSLRSEHEGSFVTCLHYGNRAQVPFNYVWPFSCETWLINRYYLLYALTIGNI